MLHALLFNSQLLNSREQRKADKERIAVKSETVFKTIALMALLLTGAASQGQRQAAKNLPNLPPLPSCFQTPDQAAQNPWKAAGMGDGVSGEKKNSLPSVCFSQPKKASLSYSWMLGGAQVVIDGMLKQPEAPARGMKTGSTHEEPGGKYAYRGGVIVFRKFTGFPDIGIDRKGQCNGAQLEYYSVTWTAVVKGKLISIDLNNYVGGKDAARGVIDGLIVPLGSAM